MWLNIHHRHMREKQKSVVYYCRHCGFGASSWNGARVKHDTWQAHWGGCRCPACGASTPPKKW